MRPLQACPDDELALVRGVLTDIDDTLTTGGRLTAAAYSALEALQEAGIAVIPVTGRPAGWCDHIARMWPVEAVVGENGAFWYRYDRGARRMLRHYALDREQRREQRARLQAVAAEILAQVPGAGIAADQAFREADLAIDFREDVPELSQAAVGRIVSLMRQHGLTVKVSSIHVNGWYGAHDKLATSLALLGGELGATVAGARKRYAFIGDSPNDAPMFGFFDMSVGVANVRAFVHEMDVLPRYVTRASHGQGFREFARSLLRVHRSRGRTASVLNG